MADTVVWIDVPVIDLDRAIRFYSAVLGAPVKKEKLATGALGMLPHEGKGIGGCLFQSESESEKPSDHGPLLYFDCSGRLEDAAAAVKDNGGKILQPKHAIGPYGFRVIVLDSEGNRVALHSA